VVKIAVLASFNMDLVMQTRRRPDAGETLQGEFAMFLGGKGFNQAVGARRLGADVVVAGRVGDDEFGRRFLDALDREGIDRRAVVVDTTAGTGVASIIVEPDGTNTILQAPRANRNVAPLDIERAAEALAGADVAMLQFETSAHGAAAFALAMRAAGTRTMLNPAPAAPAPSDLLALIDVIVPNQIEAETLTNMRLDRQDAAFAAARALIALGPAAAVITLGERGAIGAAADAQVHEPGRAVNVIDTVGAGDAFCAALAVRLAEDADLAEAVRFANAAGALACTKRGAEPSMPRRDAVEALLRDGASSARRQDSAGSANAG
jgi:ribokinase